MPCLQPTNVSLFHLRNQTHSCADKSLITQIIAPNADYHCEGSIISRNCIHARGLIAFNALIAESNRPTAIRRLRKLGFVAESELHVEPIGSIDIAARFPWQETFLL